LFSLWPAARWLNQQQPRVNLKETRLANGLRVITVEDPQRPGDSRERQL
jgi:predicted Zn-dependent peptidase